MPFRVEGDWRCQSVPVRTFPSWAYTLVQVVSLWQNPKSRLPVRGPPRSVCPAAAQSAAELLTKAKRRLSGAQELTFIEPWPP
jgi:hypothetical protein